MGRKFLYYPKSEISRPKIAKPGEFIFEDTLEPYAGPYVQAKGQFLSGAEITPESRLLKESDGLLGAKFQEEIATEYFKLTEREFGNHFEPRHSIFRPNADDYKKGQTLRFFAQKINEPFRIVEIDEDQFKSFNEENKEGIDSRLYNPISIDWVLIGENPEQINKKTLELTESFFPGFERIKISPAEFVRTTPSQGEIQENLYTSGGEFRLRDTGQEYIGAYHIHPDKGPMVGAKHVPYTHAYLIPLGQETQNGLFTRGGEFLLNGREYIGEYHIHPDKGPMAGAQHVSEPHPKLTPFNSGQQFY